MAARDAPGQARVGRVEEAAHLLGVSPLTRMAMQKAPISRSLTLAVEDLAEQVRGLLARERPRALLAAADFLDVLADAHGRDCPRGLMTPLAIS